jgi:hypothetical protein
MSEPFIFIGTHQVIGGKLREFQEDCRSLAEAVEQKEPQLVAFAFYLGPGHREAPCTRGLRENVLIVAGLGVLLILGAGLSKVTQIGVRSSNRK